VIRAFDLAKNGDGNSGPLGTKKIAEWLNARGYRSRNGSLFGTGIVPGVKFDAGWDLEQVTREAG
jgi:site-specific DNA recombinase